MGNGTVIPVYVRNLHKSNAQEVLSESRYLLEYLTRKIEILAATKETPSEGFWYEHVMSEMPSLLEEYADASFKMIMAQRLLDDPDECDDDFDEFKESSDGMLWVTPEETKEPDEKI